MKNSIYTSDQIEDIVEISKRSAESKNGIRIIELSDLGDIIPKKDAEQMRRLFIKYKTQVKQLTNHKRFQAWTEVDEFIGQCLSVKYIDPELLPINLEVLLFDDVVAYYGVEPTVTLTVIENKLFAEQQRHLFDNFWKIADPVQLSNDGSTTYSVTIKRDPEDVYAYISDLSNWPNFSDFAKDFERVTDSKYIAHTSQGDITVLAEFDPKRLLFDTTCTLPGGKTDFIPYRVVPNKEGAELMMTNFKPTESSAEDYEEQLAWMKIELNNIKQLLEH